ncbi:MULTISPECIES: hypothetical protein [Brevibacillus]|uniref:Uncharacterized protein n=1 Tax=Brevibacillus invocatus TaxID=173959 RepID=A0A3M8C8A4_9BACL|nr:MULTISPECIES: hypothetical protein [Brevibacillus]MDH4617829.1 hypothetical protein [Brevibacillus sp. AY1]RNB71944.1 hypothetical protein EDM52_14360 [Brevibacillus invocatus]
MKKIAVGLFAASLVLNIVPLDGTVAFLTSEKKQTSSISLGTNEDVFVTQTKEMTIETKITKRTVIRRTMNADGTSSETAEDKVSIDQGAQTIVFIPQRPHLDLELENLRVTGAVEGIVKVEKIESEEGIEFLISHARGEMEWKNGTVKGELHVTALGGFYDVVIPVAVTTIYKKKTDVQETNAPGNPQQPGNPSTPGTPGTPETPATPETPPPDGSTTEPTTPPPSDSADSPSPPSDEATAPPTPSTDPAPSVPSGENQGSPSPESSPESGEPAQAS